MLHYYVILLHEITGKLLIHIDNNTTVVSCEKSESPGQLGDLSAGCLVIDRVNKQKT